MPHSTSQVEETRQLVDALYDGQLDRQGFGRLELLISNNQACLQAYVERIDFHGGLLDQAETRSPEESAIAVLRRFAAACAAGERRHQRRTIAGFVAAASLVMCVGGWMWFNGLMPTAAIGNIASLSTDARSLRGNGRLELGQVVRWGETITVSSGVMSLQLPNVMLDVVSPATVRLDEPDRVSLTQGMVVAKVFTAGKGFTVRTPEAEVVDLGTEFLVRSSSAGGTEVSVRQGRAQASLLDWRGQPTQMLELTDHRAARFAAAEKLAREVEYKSEDFQVVDQSRGGIRSIDGALRTVQATPKSLLSEKLTTPNHMLVVPERQHVTLENDLVVEGLQGEVRIPAGSTVSSYLMHYDPTEVVSFAPRGAVTFFGTIAAVVGSADALSATDTTLGLQGTEYETKQFRELEIEEDEVRISDDRKTVSFFFGVSPPEFLDEARILVIERSP
ncbi:FecR domain-containing protein [Planctomicrobium piriforme]|uniref:FecR protein n=1 Tax=Planctomicrobium piriforme TaxID=1576369 RepID=A0A1I3LQ56_9PLAN|nr:FecR domain-containing protein [Planctomicrobium piriforme]SFI86861.1 FecR protein [Planctomicrobium piriforme]